MATSLTPDPLFDVLSVTASDLVLRLERREITSVEIIESYLSQIERHNLAGAKCRAVISQPPRFQLLAWAAKLDLERAGGRTRGPLHGIPILLKDVFATSSGLGMPTTAGCYALLDSCPSEDADIVKDLLSEGLIILGKTNMTELLGEKGTNGWSAVGGMCQPAYIPTGYKLGDKPRGESSPCGSSTGSAVGVACGFAPISLGSETTGSMVSPAAAASLYALKLTPGSTSLNGVFHLTASFDTVGAMGKTSLDVALACDAILRRRSAAPQSLATVARSAKPEDLAVGFVDIEKWRLPKRKQIQDEDYLKQTAREYDDAKDQLKRHGVRVFDVFITPPEEYLVGDTNVDDLMDNIIVCQSKNAIERYLTDLEYSKVRTVEDIIQFIDRHQDVELDRDYCPNQDNLISLAQNSRPDEEMHESLDHCKQWAATSGVDRIMSEYGVDVVVCCADSFFAGVSVGARYPMGTVPLSYVQSSGRPYGLHAVTKANEEDKIIKFMAVWEKIRPARRTPDLEACALARKKF